MMPVGPLMMEHRLIERMIAVFQKELTKIKEKLDADLGFVDDVVDFIRTYADKCHHGKEEFILFKELENKPLSDELRQICNELVEEHKMARETTGKIVSAKEKYLQGDFKALNDLIKYGEELIRFYPEHIVKEDKHFFIPIMKHFTQEEQDQMLEEFNRFDQRMIHDKYRGIVEELEKMASGMAKYQCTVCGYVYDPVQGDPEHGIKAGTSFEELPAKWVCPQCGSGKSVFVHVS